MGPSHVMLPCSLYASRSSGSPSATTRCLRLVSPSSPAVITYTTRFTESLHVSSAMSAGIRSRFLSLTTLPGCSEAHVFSTNTGVPFSVRSNTSTLREFSEWSYRCRDRSSSASLIAVTMSTNTSGIAIEGLPCVILTSIHVCSIMMTKK